MISKEFIDQVYRMKFILENEITELKNRSVYSADDNLAPELDQETLRQKEVQLLHLNNINDLYFKTHTKP